MLDSVFYDRLFTSRAKRSIMSAPARMGKRTSFNKSFLLGMNQPMLRVKRSLLCRDDMGGSWMTKERAEGCSGTDHHGFDIGMNGADWHDAELFDQNCCNIRCQELGKCWSEANAFYP